MDTNRVSNQELRLNQQKIIQKFFAENGFIALMCAGKEIYTMVCEMLVNLGIDNPSFVKERVRNFNNREALSKFVKISCEKSIHLLLFIDYSSKNHSNKDFILSLLDSFGRNIKCIVFSKPQGEDEQWKLLELKEKGVDSVIVTPISIDNLIEKVSNAITPNIKFEEVVRLAKLALYEGDYNQVMQYIQQLFHLKEKSPKAYLLQGEVCFKKGQKKEALMNFWEAHKVAPQFQEPLIRLVLFFRSEQNYEKELVFLLKLEDLNPENVDRKRELAEVYFHLGDEKKAKKQFEILKELAQKQERQRFAHHLFENARSSRAYDLEFAILQQEEALKILQPHLTKDDVHRFNQIAIDLRKQQRYEEAISFLDSAMMLDPNDANILFNKGRIYLEQGGEKNYEAVRWFEMALDIDPDLVKKTPILANFFITAYDRIGDVRNSQKFKALRPKSK